MDITPWLCGDDGDGGGDDGGGDDGFIMNVFLLST